MNIKKSVLPNGLRLINVSVPGLESVTCLVLFAVGSRYEDKAKVGLSHVLEHMAFKGTAKRPNPEMIASLIEGVGGESNAFTSKEVTGYFIKLSGEKTELALDILSDILLNSTLDPKELEKETGVVLEERKRNHDTPTRQIYDMIEEQVFGDQPIGWDTMGTPESLRSIRREDLTQFISQYYIPENMVLAIAGKTPSDLEDKVNKYFSPFKSGPIPSYRASVVTQSHPSVRIDNRKTEQAHLALAVEAVPRLDQDHFPLKVLETILGQGMSSRLFISVRERKGLAYTIRADAEGYHDTGIFIVYAGVGLDKVSEAVQAILDELSLVMKEKISGKELTKGKEYLKGRLKLSLEDTLSISEEFGLRELLEKRILTVDEVSSLIDKVTADDIIRVAKRIFRNEKLNLSLMGPFEDKDRFLKLLKF